MPMDVAEIKGHLDVMNAILEYFVNHMIGNIGVDINTKLGIVG